MEDNFKYFKYVDKRGKIQEFDLFDIQKKEITEKEYDMVDRDCKTKELIVENEIANNKAFALTLSADPNYVLSSITSGNVKDFTIGVVKKDGPIYRELKSAMLHRKLIVGEIIWFESWEANVMGTCKIESGVTLPVFEIPRSRGKEQYEIVSVNNYTCIEGLHLYESIEARKVKEENKMNRDEFIKDYINRHKEDGDEVCGEILIKKFLKGKYAKIKYYPTIVNDHWTYLSEVLEYRREEK